MDSSLSEIYNEAERINTLAFLIKNKSDQVGCRIDADTIILATERILKLTNGE